MPLRLFNDAESQTSGTTVTAANSGSGTANAFDTSDVVIGANMTLTYDNGVTIKGTNAFKIALTSTVTAATYVGWDANSFGVPGLGHVRGSMYFRAGTAAPTSTVRLIQFLNGSTVLGYLGWASGSGTMQWRTSADAANGGGTSGMTANTTYRLEWEFAPGTAGGAICRIYVGDTGSGGMANNVALSTGNAFAAGLVNNIRFGCTTANFSSTSGAFFLMDDITVDGPPVPVYSRPIIPALVGTPVQQALYFPTARPDDVAAGGTVFPQTMLAVVTSQGTFLKVVNKSVPATVTTAPTITKQVNKSLLATVTTPAALVKSVAKSLVASVTMTGLMSRVTQKSLAASVTLAANLTRAVTFGKAMLATVTLTPSITKVVNKHLIATVTLVAAIAKLISKALLATVTLTASMVKVVQKNLVATVTLVAALAKVFVKIVNMVATVTANASITKTVNKSLAATVTLTASIVKTVQKSLAAVVTLTPLITRVVNKGLAATVNTPAAITKVVNKSLAATVTLVGSIGRAFVPGGIIYNQAMVATVTLVGAISPVKKPFVAAGRRIRQIILNRFGQY